MPTITYLIIGINGIKVKKTSIIGNIARKKLNFVYLGNVNEREITYCPKCNNELIVRLGFTIIKNNLKNGKCPNCGYLLPGVF